MSEVKDFPVKCNQCQRPIPEGGLFYKHADHGYVCEYCPGFSDGKIKAKGESNE